MAGFAPKDIVIRTKLRSILDRLISRALDRELADPYRLIHPCPSDQPFSCDMWSLMALGEAGDEACPGRWMSVLVRAFIALYSDGLGPEADRLVYRLVYSGEVLHD